MLRACLFNLLTIQITFDDWDLGDIVLFDIQTEMLRSDFDWSFATVFLQIHQSYIAHTPSQHYNIIHCLLCNLHLKGYGHDFGEKLLSALHVYNALLRHF